MNAKIGALCGQVLLKEASGLEAVLVPPVALIHRHAWVSHLSMCAVLWKSERFAPV